VSRIHQLILSHCAAQIQIHLPASNVVYHFATVSSFTVNSLKFFTRRGGEKEAPNKPYQRVGVSPEKMLATSRCKYIFKDPRETVHLIFTATNFSYAPQTPTASSFLITSRSGWGGGDAHGRGGDAQGGRGDARASCASPLGTPLPTVLFF
jgi:hypothetical protein